MLFKKYIKIIIPFLILSTFQPFKFQTHQNSIALNKKGGICFRVDDDQSISEYLQFASVFNKYGYNFTFALNLGEYLNPSYISGVQSLQNNGHELMDHTPNHRTDNFMTIFDPINYLNLPGVDHIDNNKICLSYMHADITKSSKSGIADVENKFIISRGNGAFKNLRYDEKYIYLEIIDTLLRINKVYNSNSNDVDTIRFDNVWWESFNLPRHNDIPYYIFNYNNVHITNDAFKILANESIKLAEHYNIERPYVWIQPGGNQPHAHSYELKNSLGTLNYVAGAVYPNPAIKTYNEYNPNQDKNFAMQWGDFQDDAWYLTKIKNKIADQIAKHKMLIGHSHFYNLLNGWDGYLQRVDQILSWCYQNDIPVLTYSEMANILYKEKNDPYRNIIPPLNIDLDLNNIPDGYIGKSTEYDWTLDKTNLVPENNGYSFSINHSGGICYIEGLGGIEKSENDFSIWAKGQTGNYIEVVFSWEGNEKTFKFATQNNEWKKFNLNQSVNGNLNLIIPENISLIDIEIKCSIYSNGIINIGGMNLKKMSTNKIVYGNIKVFLEGYYISSQKLNKNIIPLTQPYNQDPWDYNGDESIEVIPDNMVDWVLVELRDEKNPNLVVSSRAALLLEDGKVADLDGTSSIEFIVPNYEPKYYVVVKHRNHLSVMSSNPVTFSSVKTLIK